MYGYQARHITQEHSYVLDMWKKLVNPGILIYLDVSLTIQSKEKTCYNGPKLTMRPRYNA
jgi:hypothetical protein